MSVHQSLSGPVNAAAGLRGNRARSPQHAPAAVAPNAAVRGGQAWPCSRTTCRGIQSAGVRRASSPGTNGDLWSFAPLAVLGATALVMTFGSAMGRLPWLSWLPFGRLRARVGLCDLDFGPVDNEPAFTAWALLVLAALAGLRRTDITATLASAALIVAVAGTAIYSATWTEAAITGSDVFATECPPTPAAAQIALEIERAQYFRGVLPVLASGVLLAYLANHGKAHADSVRHPWARGKLAWRWAAATPLLLVVATYFVLLDSRIDELHAVAGPTAEVPLSELLAPGSLLALAALVPVPKVRRLGLAVLQITLGLAFGQYAILRQILHVHTHVLVPNKGLTFDTDLSEMELQALRLGGDYYFSVLGLMLSLWAVSWAINALLRPRSRAQA